MTWCPSASSRSHRCEPMKPAEPVTATFTSQRVGSGHGSLQAPPILWFGMSRFESWLASGELGIIVKAFPQGTRTAEDAARAVGCDVGQIVKSLVFVAGGRPVVALGSGANRLDERRLAALAGDPVAKADAETAREATGYSIGGVPPFGHATEVPVFMDRDLMRYEVLWAAAGKPDSVFEIDPDRLRELSRATVSELKQ